MFLIIAAEAWLRCCSPQMRQHNDTLGNIRIASRERLRKCDDIVSSVLDKGSMKVEGRIQASAPKRTLIVARNVQLINENRITTS